MDPGALFESDPYVRGAALFWDDLTADNSAADSFAFKVSGLLLDKVEDEVEDAAAAAATATTPAATGHNAVATDVTSERASVARTIDENDTAGAPSARASKLPGYLRRRLDSGQMVVHKVRHWRQLCLAVYFNAVRSQYFWNSAFGFYGDKDTFRIAWMATRTPYALPARHVGLVGYTSGSARYTTGTQSGAPTHTTFNGHAMLQHHHVTGAPAFLHRNQRKWDPQVLRRFPPAGWNTPRVLTAVKVCLAVLTDADVAPSDCDASFSVPATLSDMV